MDLDPRNRSHACVRVRRQSYLQSASAFALRAPDHSAAEGRKREHDRNQLHSVQVRRERKAGP